MDINDKFELAGDALEEVMNDSASLLIRQACLETLSEMAIDFIEIMKRKGKYNG